ncbi:MAG: YegS/Rv2252/BmrU family lipid kinase [Lachnospiraceae bacterium]|nr:YegS/Rv2252/BmrU family lipid kinase [Lachnospiraceae bacterium]
MLQIIINPNSGSGRGRQKWQTYRRMLNLAKLTYIHHITTSASELTSYTRSVTKPELYKYTATPNRIMVLGGDGTVNHCVNGIRDLEHTTLSYLPCGTSNDLIRTLKFPTDPYESLHALGKNSVSRKIDLGNVTFESHKKRFVVSSGIGYDAAVCNEVAHSPLKSAFNKLGLGKLIYAAVALKQFLFLQPCGCDLYVDDEEPVRFDSFLVAAFMNMRHEGGGFPFAPDADPTDGLLDVCLIGNLPKWRVPFVLPYVISGKHYGKPGVHHYRASKIRIVTDRPLCTHTDGEVIGFYKDLTYECGKERLCFVK